MPTRLVFSPDSTRLAVLTSGSLSVWDPSTGRALWNVANPEAAFYWDLRWSADPTTVDSASPPREEKTPSEEKTDRCKTYDTKVRFHPNIAEAKEDAKKSKKLLFVLHISGDFEDPGFT